MRTLFFGKLYTGHTENGNSGVLINVLGHSKLTEFPGTHLKPLLKDIALESEVTKWENNNTPITTNNNVIHKVSNNKGNISLYVQQS